MGNCDDCKFLKIFESPEGNTSGAINADGDQPVVLAPHEGHRLPLGMVILWRAYRQAQAAGEEAWQFAMLVSTLEATGLGPSQLQWLVAQGVLAHAMECTQAGDRRRRFRAAPLSFGRRRCFVLTTAGAALILEAFGLGESGFVAVERASPPDALAVALDRPQWDASHRVLRVGRTVVRRFGRPAPNQELILTTFEDQGWPRRIVDPLPECRDLVFVERLHDTIKCLNRGLCPSLLHFRGDGSGRGITWELS